MTDDEQGRLGLRGSRVVWLGLGIIVILVVVLVLAVILLRDDDDAGALEVSDPWVRATIAVDDSGEMNGDSEMDRITGAFMTIRNGTDVDERLIRASTDIAGAVEIHETTIENDVMRMRPVEGVDIPAGGSVALEPGGLHIMLMGMGQDLVPGDMVSLKLDFESGRSLVIEAPVRPLE
jgi:periplasmic copper chaperone A